MVAFFSFACRYAVVAAPVRITNVVTTHASLEERYFVFDPPSLRRSIHHAETDFEQTESATL